MKELFGPELSPPLDGFSDAVVQVDCGDERHSIAWTPSGISALDHPDPEAEKVLVGLGGQQPLCLEVLDAWRYSLGDCEMLGVAARGNDRPDLRSALAMTQRTFASSLGLAAMKLWVGAFRAGDFDAERRLRATKVIANLPLDLRRLFIVSSVATVEKTIRAGGHLPRRSFQQAVDSIVGRLVLRAIRSDLGSSGQHLQPYVMFRAGPATRHRCRVIESHEGVTVEVPLRWFAQVHARGLQDGWRDLVLGLDELLGPVALTWDRGAGGLEPRLGAPRPNRMTP